MLTDTSGTSVETFRYDAWGKMEPEPMWDLTYTYIGRERDIDSGLMYLMARYYNPETGRFLSRDPIRIGGGLNYYIYVKNKVTNNKDIYGLQDERPPDICVVSCECEPPGYFCFCNRVETWWWGFIPYKVIITPIGLVQFSKPLCVVSLLISCLEWDIFIMGGT